MNPKIVMARIMGFGLSGPHHEYKSFDRTAQAMGGVMSVPASPTASRSAAAPPSVTPARRAHRRRHHGATYIHRQGTGEG